MYCICSVHVYTGPRSALLGPPGPPPEFPPHDGMGPPPPRGGPGGFGGPPPHDDFHRGPPGDGGHPSMGPPSEDPGELLSSLFECCSLDRPHLYESALHIIRYMCMCRGVG